MSSNYARKRMYCYVAYCPKCDSGGDRPGHIIDIAYHGTSDTVRVDLDGETLLSLSDDIWDAIVELDRIGGHDDDHSVPPLPQPLSR